MCTVLLMKSFFVNATELIANLLQHSQVVIFWGSYKELN